MSMQVPGMVAAVTTHRKCFKTVTKTGKESCVRKAYFRGAAIVP